MKLETGREQRLGLNEKENLKKNLEENRMIYALRIIKLLLILAMIGEMLLLLQQRDHIPEVIIMSGIVWLISNTPVK